MMKTVIDISNSKKTIIGIKRAAISMKEKDARLFLDNCLEKLFQLKKKSTTRKIEKEIEKTMKWIENFTDSMSATLFWIEPEIKKNIPLTEELARKQVFSVITSFDFKDIKAVEDLMLDAIRVDGTYSNAIKNMIPLKERIKSKKSELETRGRKKEHVTDFISCFNYTYDWDETIQPLVSDYFNANGFSGTCMELVALIKVLIEKGYFSKKTYSSIGEAFIYTYSPKTFGKSSIRPKVYCKKAYASFNRKITLRIKPNTLK